MGHPSVNILLTSLLYLTENNLLIKSVKDFSSLFSLNYDCSKGSSLDHHTWLWRLNHGPKHSFLSFQDERQNKIHPLAQQQALVFPNADPIPFAILPQNVLPLAQPAVVLPLPQPEIVQVPQIKENIAATRKTMPFLKSPVAPLLNSQIQNLADPENLHLAQLQSQLLPLPLPLPHASALAHSLSFYLK